MCMNSRTLSPMRSPTKSSIAGLLAAITVVTTGGAVRATTVPDDDGSDVVIIDEGKGDERLDLNARMIVGTTANAVDTTRTTGTIQASGAQSLDEDIDVTTTVEQSVEVTDVTSDGGYTITRTVDSYDVTVNSGSVDMADSFKDDEELEPLVGVNLEQTYDATGQLLDVVPAAGASLTPAQQASVDVVLDEGTERQPFPDVEVGVGAVWEAELPDTGGAIARFELESILDGTAVIQLSFEGDPAAIEGLAPAGFDEVTGTMLGGGTYAVNVDNRLDTSSEFTLQLDVTMSGQGVEMTMAIESTNTRVVTLG